MLKENKFVDGILKETVDSGLKLMDGVKITFTKAGASIRERLTGEHIIGSINAYGDEVEKLAADNMKELKEIIGCPIN